MIKILTVWILLSVFLFAACSTKPPKKTSHTEPSILQMQMPDFDTLFEELAQTGERTNEELERIKQENKEELLDYLMADFMAGGLEGCQLDDGSAGTLKFYTWSGFLGIESLELVLESPQQYWEEWSSHVKRIYDLNGMAFMEEQNYPIGVRYINLLNNTSDGVE